MPPAPSLPTAAPRPFSQSELEALHRVVARDAPQFAHRVSPALQRVPVDQPFFVSHPVLEIRSPLPMPAMRLHAFEPSPGEFVILTRHPAQLAGLVRLESPQGLHETAAAVAFAHAADFWTTENELGDLPISSIDEIPFRAQLSDADRARIASLNATVGPRLGPAVTERRGDCVVVTKCVLANRRLLRRVLTVTTSGAFTRDDELLAGDLPVPPGRYWGFVKGRLVPTG